MTDLHHSRSASLFHEETLAHDVHTLHFAQLLRMGFGVAAAAMLPAPLYPPRQYVVSASHHDEETLAHHVHLASSPAAPQAQLRQEATPALTSY